MLSVHQMITEDNEKWSQDTDVDEGKMHRILNIPQNKQIEDVYSDGKKLVDDLRDKVDDEQEVSGMVNYVAGLTDSQLYKDAQDYLSKNNEES